MDKLIGGIIGIVIVGVILTYVTALVSALFCIIIYLVCKVSNPLIRKDAFGEVVFFAFGWGLIVTLFFAFSTYLTSDLFYNRVIFDDLAFWINAANFGIILMLSAFLANRVALVRRFRRTLSLLQPFFIVFIGFSVTLVFDVYLRGQGQLLDVLDIENLKNFSAYEFISVVTEAVSNLKNDVFHIFKFGYQKYAANHGSAFALTPFISILSIIWFCLYFSGRIFGFFETKIPEVDDGIGKGAMYVCLSALLLNAVGFGLIIFAVETINGIGRFGSDNSNGIDGIWGLLKALLALVAMIAGPIIVFLTPFIWISSFATASFSASPGYVEKISTDST